MDLTSTHIVPNLRHQRALSEAATFLKTAQQALTEAAPTEIVAEEFNNALAALGEIIGETTHEEILDHIFSQFCLGK
jgi:tRNA modification GTPase